MRISGIVSSHPAHKAPRACRDGRRSQSCTHSVCRRSSSGCAVGMHMHGMRGEGGSSSSRGPCASRGRIPRGVVVGAILRARTGDDDGQLRGGCGTAQEVLSLRGYMAINVTSACRRRVGWQAQCCASPRPVDVLNMSVAGSSLLTTLVSYAHLCVSQIT